MQYWRNILFLVALLCGWQSSGAPGNIQGIPTPWMYVTANNTSFDAFDKYSVGQNLQGLNKSDAATLGAKFTRAYVSRQSYFGVLVDDRLTAYSAGQNLNGLNKGDNWSTAYVVHGTLPYIVWDTFTNSTYTVGANLAGLNGGDNNNHSLQAFWNGPFSVNYPVPFITLNGSPPTCHYAAAGYTDFYFTVDGSAPVCGRVDHECDSGNCGDVDGATGTLHVTTTGFWGNSTGITIRMIGTSDGCTHVSDILVYVTGANCISP